MPHSDSCKLLVKVTIFYCKLQKADHCLIWDEVIIFIFREGNRAAAENLASSFYRKICPLSHRAYLAAKRNFIYAFAKSNNIPFVFAHIDSGGEIAAASCTDMVMLYDNP